MKTIAKAILQATLGFHRYLVTHSLFVAATMRLRRKEGDVLTFIDRLAPDACVLDIGANVGTMTLLFARRCPRGKVIAFEPIPDNLLAAEAVLKICRVKNVVLYGLGVGERTETLTMVMPNFGKRVRMEGVSHVVRNPGFDDIGTLYHVPFIALDDFPEIADQRIDAIKIDVEDHEQFVLKGARRVIERDMPLIYCELWGHVNKTACFTLLHELRYSAHVSVRGTLEPYDEKVHRQINFFFLPPHSNKVETSHASLPQVPVYPDWE